MPAELGDNFIDTIAGVLDDVRDQVDTALGVSQWRVAVVRRQWSGDRRGEGYPSDSVVEMVPRPRVTTVAVMNDLRPGGRDEEGQLKVRFVSLVQFTEEDLAPTGLAETEEHFFVVWDAYGQNQRPRFYTNARPPMPDRVKDIGWVLYLKRTSDVRDFDLEDLVATKQAAQAIFDTVGPMNVDGSVAAQTLTYTCPGAKRAAVQKINLVLVNDGGTFKLGTFGGTGAALANGIKLELLDSNGTVLANLVDSVGTDHETVVADGDWSLLGKRDQATDGYTIEIDVGVAMPDGLRLDAGQQIQFTIQDNLTGLDSFYAQVQGYLIDA